jgi:hypothetical protein
MTKMNKSPEQLLPSLIGKSPWQISVGAESVVSMEFGAHDPRQSGVKVHGEWSLWLNLCAWRIELPDSILVGSEDSRDAIRTAFRELNWQPIREITLEKPSVDLNILFDGGVRLRTFAVNSSGETNEQWILYTPYLKTIIAKAGRLEFEEYPLEVSTTPNSAD